MSNSTELYTLQALKSLTYNTKLDFKDLIRSGFQTTDMIRTIQDAEKWLSSTPVTRRSKLVANNLSVLEALVRP